MDGNTALVFSTVISLVGTTLITTVVGFVVKHYMNKQVKNKQEKERELQALRDERHRAERKRDTMDIIKETIAPLEKKIDDIGSKLSKVEDGTQSTLRNDILECYYKCLEKGYRSRYDYENVHHMYDSYKELKGNSYVAEVVKKFDEDIPSKEEWKQTHENKAKTSAPRAKKTKGNKEERP